MLLLPTFQATLRPCPVGPAAFTPHPQGSFCGQCQRVVQDFSESANPVADLAAARAAAPDGRVCGRFRAAQVQRPKLTQRLKWFVLALVLVVGQGLTAREALAQVRKAVPKRAHSANKPQQSRRIVLLGDVEDLPPRKELVHGYGPVEIPPSFQGGGLPAAAAYIQQHLRWPLAYDLPWVEGRVFVRFQVDTLGRVHAAQVVKGLHPLLDAEALRVVQALPNFTPGTQNGRLIDMSLTVPITFKRE